MAKVGKTYQTKTKTVDAIQFGFDTLKDVYVFMNKTDVNYTIKLGSLTGIVTDNNGTKLSISKGNYIVKDVDGNFSIYTETEFFTDFEITETVD